MLTEAGGSKKLKGEFASQYGKKYLQLGFTGTPCSKQIPRPLCFVCSKFIKRCNETLLTCSSVVTFIRSIAMFNASHWINYFQRLFREMSSQKKQTNK